ncbi:YncE family protein [Janibacter sp. G56]|uniref:YncE family protein n=1 Tax=Janibacter sp. G56 TaxID=3418717 RepID=UPI003D0299A5
MSQPDPGPKHASGERRRVSTDPVHVRRRRIAGVLAAVLALVVVSGAIRLVGGLFGDGATTAAVDQPAKNAAAASRSAQAKQAKETKAEPEAEVPAPEPTPDRRQGDQASSGKSGLARIQTLGGEQMAPKSVVASAQGTLFAQNMMYRHSVSVFNADGALVRTIPDEVNLEDFGIEGHGTSSKGAPVEMAFSPDGKTAWVSNYSMYGEGFGPEGSDSCVPGDGTDDSYVYRIDVATDEIQEVIKVGAVPKYVAATPDGSKVLVTNWCTWDLSVIDTKTNTEIKRVPLDGRYPRGIAVTPDSSTAYIAIMGSDRMVAVDLGSYAVSEFTAPGDSPRHVVISPDGDTLYVSNNRDGNVVKIDRESGEILGSVATGNEPRSMAISSDGEALYVVNYASNTMTKVTTAEMTAVQTVQTDPLPIGITYEPTKKRVWVACYNGTVLVYDDSRVLTD